MADIHNPRVIGDMTLTRAPSLPEHPVRKQDLDQALQEYGSIKALFITDVTPTSSGIVSNKQYADSLPANSILVSAVADTENVRVHFVAQGALFTPPQVAVNGVEVANFTPVAAGSDLFSGFADITMNASGDITVVSGTGVAKVALTVATEGPALSMVVIGALPGVQTEVKAGDVVPFTAVVANDAVSVTVQNIGAAASGSNIVLGAADSAGTGFKTVVGNFTVANRSNAQSITLVAKNALGTDGEPAVSGNTVILNQTAPTIATITVAYPNGQGALKVGEVATVTSAVTNADSVSYSATGGSVDAPNEYAASKQFTLESGTYNYSSNNYTITAVKASNGATATRSGVVRVAVDAPAASITVDGNPARLRSSAEGQTYTLRVTANQQLASAPVVDLSNGTWAGNWTGTGTVYTRTFTVSDSDDRGDLVAGATFYGLAGVQGTREQTFVVGGFVKRTLTVAAFSQIVEIGAAVSSIGKVRVNYGGSATLLTLRNDKENAPSSFTIVNSAGDYDPNGTHLWLSDADYAGSNTSGTLQVEIEEII